ncbi:MAG: fibronectin type III domain-containing protein, partial [Firmicutes bacterium]|nr:fibronectin type III domain-containing protein [Bacillota bacterium]
TSGSTVTFTDTKANTNGTKYTFKVVPYASTGDGTSKTLTTYRVSKPAITSATNSAAGKATVKWGKNAKATGYEIWYSTSSSFSTKKTKAITKYTTVSTTLSSLTKGKTYYVKIRTYKTVSGKKYYSAWSAVKTVKITK